MRQLDSITDSMDRNLSKLLEVVEAGRLVCRSLWGSQRIRQDLATEQNKFEYKNTLFSKINKHMKILNIRQQGNANQKQEKVLHTH